MERPDKVDCCKELECESGRRNNYFEGKRLTADSFRVEQRYLIERRQLLNRAMFGWGVVYGYSIAGNGGLKIGPGLALDECGRELLQACERTLKIDDLHVLDEKNARSDVERVFSTGVGAEGYGRPERVCWMLSAHYAEQNIGPVPVKDPCQCEHQEWEHTCETVRYTLRRVPCSDCCRECDCELDCKCASGGCCDEHECGPLKRGGCRCICDYLTNLPMESDCRGPLSPEIEEPCGGSVRIDFRHGVPLACVKLRRDECDGWAFEEIEPCGPRRLVKRNDLLFDLIRGCDLTRISKIGWAKWHRSRDLVPFDQFSDALGAKDHDKDEYVTRDFWVEFSRPVRADTLRPDCFAITVLSGEREGGWWQVQRVPIVGIDPIDQNGDYVRGAKIVVDGAWIEDGVRGRRSVFIDCETTVEIEIRGDFIVDCNGQTVDAEPIGLSPAPTGNGGPGGTFISTFRVGAREEQSYKGASS